MHVERVTAESQTSEARPWVRNADGSYTCQRHQHTFRMPRSCAACDKDPAAQPDRAVTPFLPPPPDGCLATVALEVDANDVRAQASTIRGELTELANALRDEIADLRKARVKAKEYYRELALLAEVRIRALGELRKQGDLQLKANRRAGDYAVRREDDYIVDKRNEAMRGGSH